MPATVTEKPPRREVIAMLGDAVAAMDALLPMRAAPSASV